MERPDRTASFSRKLGLRDDSGQSRSSFVTILPLNARLDLAFLELSTLKGSGDQ